MKIKPFIVLLLTAFVIGCASTSQEVLFDQAKRKPTTSVDVFREGSKPTKPYKEIGEVSFEEFGGEDARAMKELIAKAQKIGANCIVMLPRQETGYNFNPFGRSGNKYIWKAVAGVYE
jgi:hypothetical protein